MDVEEIVRTVFGHGCIADENDQLVGTKSKTYSTRRQRSLTQAEEFVKAALAELDGAKTQDDKRPGRIGPAIVRFDVSTHHGLFIVSPDRLSVNSQSNFSTMRANAALYGEKWMYEVQLGSKGVMQIGWGTAQCKFSQESGVGDTSTSYAYDGNRVRKWNVTTHKYGDPWLSGDIIGCTLDMNECTISFYRNGRPLGIAFKQISNGAGTAYFPTVSLAFTENLTANFGATPLKYPVEGYQTLQAPPTDELNKTALILEWLANLIPLIKRGREANSDDWNDAANVDERSMSVDAYFTCLGRMILKHLGPLLTVPYVTEALFIPFVQKICPTADERWKLMICLDLLWMFLEEHEIKACLENCVVSLLSAFRHVSLMLAYPDQSDNLIPLINLCYHTATRQYLLQHVLFDRVRFANFLHVKPLDERGLGEVVDKIWWQTTPLDVSVETSKQSYMESCDEIKNAIWELECLQIELLILLLDNSDGTACTPSSRTIFLRKFRRFVQDNLISSRTPLPITVCCFHRLLGAFKILWTDFGEPMFIPCRSFYDSSISYNGIDRLGGVLSHLNKTYKNDLINQLGADHEIITSMDQPQDSPNTFMGGPGRISDLPTFARLIRMNSSGPAVPMMLERLGYTQYTREDRTPLLLGEADENLSLIELLDGIVLFYHAAAKKQIAKVAALRESMNDYVNALSETKARLELMKRSKDPEAQSVQKELIRTIGVFRTKLTEQARHMAWVRAAVYSEEKQTQIAWLLRMVTLTLKMSSQEGNMFSFVPDFYLEALSDLSVGLRSHLHPTAPIEKIPGYEKMLLEVAQFLCDHFLDRRIVHANAKDTLILTIAGFISNPLTLKALEQVPRKSRVNFVTNLLRPYENRAWAQSNWVLVRFWLGNGFAFRYEKSPHLLKKLGPKMLQQDSITQPIKPYPSSIYQRHVKEVLLNNLQATTQFLNSLLNQLNWAFSEFIGMVQEIHNVSSRPERVFIESRQLKICATCFDLAVSLLRVIEMIAAIAPSIFNDPSQSSSENLLVRLCQLLCQILNRVSSQTSSFQHVVLLDISDLETVDHFPILAAVIGILLALLAEEMADNDAESEQVPRATRTLLSEPSFQMSSLYFVLGEVATKKPKMKNLKPFTFLNYKDDVSEQEIIKVRDMINHLDTSRALLPETRLTSDDDDTCTICYAYPVAVTFKPCNHQSCRGCIDRHVLNSRECFFCKTIITEVRDLAGLLLHDLRADSASPKSPSTP